jgi:hypothetical protein
VGLIRKRAAGAFVAATFALTGLAWFATELARVPGRDRLDYRIFDRLFVFTDRWGALVEIFILVLVFTIPALRQAGIRCVTLFAEHPRTVASVSLLVLAALALIGYRATPFSMDEYSQVAQAYAFAHGHLSWHEPPALLDRMIPPGFRDYFLAVDPHTGEIASLYWPGFAALLAPFAFAGVPWLLNPALGAFSLLLIHGIVTRLRMSPDAAGWAVLLTLASPAFTVNSISLYSMPAHLALNLLYAWWLLDGRPSRAIFAGLTGSVALVLHNPVPHLLFAAPWILWMLCGKERRRLLPLLAVGYLPSLIVGFGWPLMTQAISVHDSAASVDHLDALQLAANKLSAVFSLPTSHLVGARVDATWKIWIWSTPGLLILTALGSRESSVPLRLFAASALLTYLVYWLVPFDQGHGWGYRYLYSAWVALPLLGAAFLSRDSRETEAATAILPWAAGMAIGSLILANGFWFWQVREVIGEHLAQRIPAPSSGRWLVFVRARHGLYSWDMIQNLPYDTHQTVLMSFGSQSDEALVQEQFPGAQRTLADARGSEWRLPDRN